MIERLHLLAGALDTAIKAYWELLLGESNEKAVPPETATEYVSPCADDGPSVPEA
jgi:hypothetical protein